MSYDKVKAAFLVNSNELAHLHLGGPMENIYSAHDSEDDKNLFAQTLADITSRIVIRRLDGLPVTRMAQDTINTFTFHFIRIVLKHFKIVSYYDNTYSYNLY